MSNFIDVHTFDGKWNHDITTKHNLEYKEKIFNVLLEEVKKIGTDDSIKGLTLVIENTQKQPNYDCSNKLFADDILVEICIKLSAIDNEDHRNDILRLLSEQMCDMYKLGQCPQGRTTRLIQVWNSIRECEISS